MKGKLKKKGKYELFNTTENHQILSLDEKQFFALVKGQKGDIIVHSDSDHKKKKSVSEGKYYYADFKDDPEFKDMTHLFMEDNSKFREFILPEGFPTKQDPQKKIIRPKEKLNKSKVENHVDIGKKGNGKQSKREEEALNDKTKKELYEMAKKEDIGGRSKMNKKQLIKNLLKE